MIIVSQDKTRTFNFNNITELFIGYADENKKRSIRCQNINETYEELGIYETEERAKEVLIAIGAYYGLCEIYKYGEQSDRDKINNYAAERGLEPFIFPIPEE